MGKLGKFKIIYLIPAAALLLSGCSLSLNTGGSNSGSDGGVFTSVNKGNVWSQRTMVLSASGPRSFASADIIDLALDPNDSQAVYAGIFDNGLLYSYDGGAGWQIATALGKITVNNVAVDPADKCVVYATSANKVFKSEDCNRTWSQVYFDNDLKVSITALAVDHFNAANVFIGTSRGDLIKSADRGASWRVAERLDSSVSKIVISPSDSKIMFAGTSSRGLFRSTDNGERWSSLADRLKSFNNSTRFRDLVALKADSRTLFMATTYGLLKSTDNGDSWSALELLTPEREATINSVAVNPDNSKEIYYVTNTAFYRSADGGVNWTSKKLPSGRAGSELLINPDNPSMIYLAVKNIK
ncbi:MAG: hypothetical protein Q8O93_03465 [bacterium]|nr:hypothetical protein [bacterium]